MTTTTAATKPAAKTFACRMCTSGVVRQYRSMGAWNERCRGCKGTGTVSAAVLLKQVSGGARADLSRQEAICLVALYLGLDETGRRIPEREPSVIAENGFGGLLLDCEVRGWSDIVERAIARASMLYAKPETYRPMLNAGMALIRDARAAL